MSEMYSQTGNICLSGVLQARWCRKKRCSRWSWTIHCRVNRTLMWTRSSGWSCHGTSPKFLCKG